MQGFVLNVEDEAVMMRIATFNPNGTTTGLQTAKLLLNLNNGVCAATGLSIAESVRSRELRRYFSLCITEGLAATKAAAMPVARIGRLAPPLIARLLRLHDFVFTRLAGSFVKIDPEARSSTLQDLERGKTTEIDYLNGEVVRIAEANGLRAPANKVIVEAVHELEAATDPLPFLNAAQLHLRYEAARS